MSQINYRRKDVNENIESNFRLLNSKASQNQKQKIDESSYVSNETKPHKCPACEILQMYSNADTFIGSIECVMCNAIISPVAQVNSAQPTNTTKEIKSKTKNEKNNANTIYMCGHEWCPFSLRLKGGLSHAQAKYRIKVHEEKCRDNRTKGRRFKRIINKMGMEQGHYVSIKKNGSGFTNVIPKTERFDDD